MSHGLLWRGGISSPLSLCARKTGVGSALFIGQAICRRSLPDGFGSLCTSSGISSRNAVFSWSASSSPPPAPQFREVRDPGRGICGRGSIKGGETLVCDPPSACGETGLVGDAARRDTNPGPSPHESRSSSLRMGFTTMTYSAFGLL